MPDALQLLEPRSKHEQAQTNVEAGLSFLANEWARPSVVVVGGASFQVSRTQSLVHFKAARVLLMSAPRPKPSGALLAKHEKDPCRCFCTSKPPS
jgi:hypothetical protein